MPHVIQTTVPNLLEPHDFPGEFYRMVSVPLDFGAAFIRTLESLLGDQPEFGSPYDPLKWRAFRYAPAGSTWVELSEAGPIEDHSVRPGKAFWLISRTTNRIDTAPAVGTSIDTNEH